MMDLPDHVTVNEAAALAHTSPANIRNWIRRHPDRLAYARDPGGYTLKDDHGRKLLPAAAVTTLANTRNQPKEKPAPWTATT